MLTQRRLALIVGFAAVASAAMVTQHYRDLPAEWSDFDQFWLGARALLQGRNPYEAVPHDGFPWGLFYPLPTLLLAVPFALFPLEIARALFAASSSAICAWAILRYRPHAWPLLLSGPYFYAVVRGQWAPLLVSGALVPVIGGLWIVKPSTGLATAVFRPTVLSAAVAIALLVISVAVMPMWPKAWLVSIHGQRHFVPPVSLPGGFLLLLALLRWRRPEARLLAILVCVPQTPALYELVPLGLIPRSLRASLIFAVLLSIAYVVPGLPPAPMIPGSVPQHFFPKRWPYELFLVYLPALIMVLSLPNGERVRMANEQLMAVPRD